MEESVALATDSSSFIEKSKIKNPHLQHINELAVLKVQKQ
jgi:hypothetical protein